MADETKKARKRREGAKALQIAGKVAEMFQEEWDARVENLVSPPSTQTQLAQDLIAEAIVERRRERGE